MPLFMDVHKNVEGLTAEGAAEGHAKDLEVQGKYGVKYLHYWLNEAEGTVFCLCEAPSKEAAEAVHPKPTAASPMKSSRSKRANSSSTGPLLAPDNRGL